MEQQTNITLDTRYQIKLVSLISLGIFLFMLFFQPFTIQIEAFNDLLIFVLGVAMITFIILLVFRIILPVSITRRIHLESVKISNEVGLILLIWFFITASNICYLHFVGKVELNLASGVQIALFSAFPSVILKLADVNMMLREQLKHFVRRNLKLEREITRAREKSTEPVLLRSESKNDDMKILPDDLVLVRSADNYVHVVFRTEEGISKRMLRNTMKNIQSDLNDHPEFVRCHRTCIVNSSYILNITNNYRGHHLTLLDIDEEIPVSRQYLMGVKSLMDAE